MVVLVAIILSSAIIYNYESARPTIYGKTYVYLIDRYYTFNNETINFTEFQTLKFGTSTPEGTLSINVTEVEQQYTALINITTGKVINVYYNGNESEMLNSGQGSVENLYISPRMFPSVGQNITLLNYTMNALGYVIIKLPSGYRDKTLLLQYVNSSTSNGTSYYTRITFYYSKSTGVLLRSSFLTRSVGVTGDYLRNETSTLYKVY